MIARLTHSGIDVECVPLDIDEHRQRSDTRETAVAVEMNEIAGTITSLPGPIFHGFQNHFERHRAVDRTDAELAMLECRKLPLEARHHFMKAAPSIGIGALHEATPFRARPLRATCGMFI